MASQLRVPPGRAGRLWLTGRLLTAGQAATMLDRKLRILRGERDRFVIAADRAQSEWVEAAYDADAGAARVALLGGQRELRHAAPGSLAAVTVEYTTMMGVRYPRSAAVAVPAGEVDAKPIGTAALLPATAAHGRALQAAVAVAAATGALRVVEAEIVDVRRRLYAISEVWIPRLTASLRRRSEELEEAERADTIRLRWAAARGGQR